MCNSYNLHMKEKLTIREASWLLDMSGSAIRYWILQGLQTIPDSKPLQVDKIDLLNFANQRKKVGRPRKEIKTNSC